jgi:hypothetical protein
MKGAATMSGITSTSRIPATALAVLIFLPAMGWGRMPIPATRRLPWRWVATFMAPPQRKFALETSLGWPAGKPGLRPPASAPRRR